MAEIKRPQVEIGYRTEQAKENNTQTGAWGNRITTELHNFSGECLYKRVHLPDWAALKKSEDWWIRWISADQETIRRNRFLD